MDPIPPHGSHAMNMDGLLFGQQPLSLIQVAATPNVQEQGGVVLMLCPRLDRKPARDLRVAISCARAAIWRATTGAEIEAMLAQMREQGQPFDQDTPLFQMRLEGIEREREVTSQLGRTYRLTVFEVSRWFYRIRPGGTVMRGQPVNH
ncbi:MAG: hypothetical protein QM682_16750 [Paracoccus sp. (in: a-proteobacteria)]|uniref:hypothetical protein n=1 Tax=Paracoccus sp. TaxID=267 RepID=UPI0039E65642